MPIKTQNNIVQRCLPSKREHSCIQGTRRGYHGNQCLG